MVERQGELRLRQFHIARAYLEQIRTVFEEIGDHRPIWIWNVESGTGAYHLLPAEGRIVLLRGSSWENATVSLIHRMEMEHPDQAIEVSLEEMDRRLTESGNQYRVEQQLVFALARSFRNRAN